MRDKQAAVALLMLAAIALFGGWLTSVTAHYPATCPQAQAYRAFNR